MADYSNIKRVIIRRLVSIDDACTAYRILQELNLQINVIKDMAEKQVLPKIVINRLMMNIDAGIERAVQLAGFANADDMKYWIENF